MKPLTVFESLVRLETRLWNELDHELLRQGHASLVQTGVVRVIAATPGCRVLDIASTLDITHGGASKIVDRLVAAGVVVRSPHPTDRRASVLTLTPEGVAALVAAEATADAWLQARLAGPLRTHLDALHHHLEGETR